MKLAQELMTPAGGGGELAWLWADECPGEGREQAGWEFLTAGQIRNPEPEGLDNRWIFTADHEERGWLTDSYQACLTTSSEAGGALTWEVEVREFLGKGSPGVETFGVGGYVYVTQPDGLQRWLLITGQEVPGDGGRWDGRVIWQEAKGRSTFTLTCLDESGQEFCLELDEPGRRRRWQLQAEPVWDFFPPLGLTEPRAGGSLGGYLYVMEPDGRPRWAYVHGAQAAGQDGLAAVIPGPTGLSALEVVLRGLLALGTGT